MKWPLLRQIPLILKKNKSEIEKILQEIDSLQKILDSIDSSSTDRNAKITPSIKPPVQKQK